jgi:hypothetical protein
MQQQNLAFFHGASQNNFFRFPDQTPTVFFHQPGFCLNPVYVSARPYKKKFFRAERGQKGKRKEEKMAKGKRGKEYRGRILG